MLFNRFGLQITQLFFTKSHRWDYDAKKNTLHAFKHTFFLFFIFILFSFTPFTAKHFILIIYFGTLVLW